VPGGPLLPSIPGRRCAICSLLKLVRALLPPAAKATRATMGACPRRLWRALRDGVARIAVPMRRFLLKLQHFCGHA